MENKFESIKGYKVIKDELNLFIDIFGNSKKYKEIGVYTPRGVMFVGVPGTGKTTMAMALINASNRKSYVIKKCYSNKEFINKIKNTFEQARENAPSIVLLDDFDKFSNTGTSNKNSDEFVCVQTEIDKCKDYEVFVIATVNKINSLPSSLLRTGRFDKILNISTPNLLDSREIIKYYLSKKKNIGNVDFDLIASMMKGKSCSDLKTIVNEAGIIAAYNNKLTIDTEDVIKAFLKIVFKSYKGNEGYSETFRRQISYHEAGHVLLAELFYDGSVDFVSTLYCSDDKYAVTSLNVNYLCYNEEVYKRSIMISLGGKAAVEVMTGIIDTMCSGDLEEAFKKASSFVDFNGGMGFDKCYWYTDGERMRDEKATVVSNLLDELYLQAKKKLIQYRDVLEQIVNLLMSKDFVLGSEIRNLIKGENKCN